MGMYFLIGISEVKTEFILIHVGFNVKSKKKMFFSFWSLKLHIRDYDCA